MGVGKTRGGMVAVNMIGTDRDGVLVVRLEGVDSLVASNSADFRERFDACIGEANRIALHLGNLTFMDSSGIGALVGAFKKLSKREGELRLIGLTPTVKSLFEITRLHRVFEIYDTEDKAVASFA